MEVAKGSVAVAVSVSVSALTPASVELVSLPAAPPWVETLAELSH